MKKNPMLMINQIFFFINRNYFKPLRNFVLVIFTTVFVKWKQF